MSDLIVMLVYKCTCIGSGMVSIALGYRLFVLGITAPAGDLSGSARGTTIKVTHAAPGTFFSLFGAAIIAITIWKGLEIDPTPDGTDQGAVAGAAPAQPPTDPGTSSAQPTIKSLAQRMADAKQRIAAQTSAAPTEAPAVEAASENASDPAPGNEPARAKKPKKNNKKAPPKPDEPTR